MIAFLALIGLIALFWLLSKMFTKLGVFLESLSKTMTERNISKQFINHSKEQEEIIQGLKDLNKKIDTMHNAEYQDRVRQEIDYLTDTKE